MQKGLKAMLLGAKDRIGVNLRSVIDDEKISLVILDHTENVGNPTYWHARGYGLFAANPLGQEAFSDGSEA